MKDSEESNHEKMEDMGEKTHDHDNKHMMILIRMKYRSFMKHHDDIGNGYRSNIQWMVHDT